MKFNYLIIYCYFIILIIIYNNCLIDGQLTRISQPNNLKVTVIKDAIYTTYPYKSTDNYCSFGIWLYVSTDNINDTPDTLISLELTKGIILNQDSTYKIYSTQPTTSTLLQGNSLVYTIQANSTLDTAIYQVNFTCLPFNYDEIKVDFIGDSFFSSSINSFVSTIKINGVGGHVFNLAFDSTLGDMASLQSLNCYYIYWRGQYVKENLLSNWTITIGIGTQTYTITTRSYYYQDLPTTLLSQTIIPNNFANTSVAFTEFGYHYAPIFQNRYDSGYIRPFDFLESLTYLSIPIKGVKGDMTFQYCFMSNRFDGVTPIKFSLFSQNDSRVISTVYEMIVKEFLPPKLNTVVSIDYMGSYSTLSFAAQFTSTNYNFQEFGFYMDDSLYFKKAFPFGFISGTNTQFIHKVVFSRGLSIRQASPRYTLITEPIPSDRIDNALNSNPVVSIPPTINSFEIIRYPGITDLIRINFVSTIGLQYISKSYPTGFTTMENLIDGTIFNGTMEFFTLPFSEEYAFTFTDLNGYSKDSMYGNFYSMSPTPLMFNLPNYTKYKLELSSFFNITFSDNDLNLLNQTGYTVLELSSSTIPIDIDMSVLLMDPISYQASDPNAIARATFPLVYDINTRTWKCKLVIPKNNVFDEIPYVIMYPLEGQIFSQTLPYSARLRVSKTYLDNQGPLFSNIQKFSTPNSGNFGWGFTIVDDWNGFERGYIKVMGSIDSSKYEFNFTSADRINGTPNNGEYNIVINMDASKCITQDYFITNVELYDTNQLESVYFQFGSYQHVNKNPFQNLYRIPSNMGIIINQYTCTTSTLDPTEPTLASFDFMYSGTTSPSLIDVGLANRVISFYFEIQLGTSGIKDKQFPVVYIITKTMFSHECTSSIVSNNGTHASFTCSTELPIAFGYSGELLFSIYGYINNGGNYFGWSTEDLLSLGFNGFTNTSLSVNIPVIGSVDKFYSDGGTLIIHGRGFLNTLNVLVKTNIQSSTFDKTLIPTKIYGTVLIIENVFSTTTPFKIAVSTGNSLQSNEFIVNPIYFISANPTSTPIPTASVIPTNPPKKCLGTPVCGGEKQGYCSSNGCICLSPWVGLDCTSQVIIVPQPIINNTDPSTSIPVDGDNGGTTSTTGNDNGKEQIFFKSLISIVSLRELNFKNQQVNNYIFDQWIYTPLSDTRNQYFTSIKGSKTSDQLTNVTVILEWFNKSSTVSFANQNLTMNPSSIKYTIEITEYPFAGNLNQLQLVMSAEFQSNKVNDVCLVNDFGDTTSGDNSNYLKIQIENHSLYGRFIKRAIIDGKVTSIDNILLDSSFNEINDKQSKSQAFIGITIPHYNQLILVDPDFSVLIDSNNAHNGNNPNTICSDNGKRGLTSSQLAGIIIGSVAFAIVIVVVVVYSYKKTKNQKKFLEGMNQKMNNLNK